MASCGLHGGFDSNGVLTVEPGPIEISQRILPMGFWKGSAFTVILDILAAVLSEGLPTNAIDRLQLGSCVGCSQIFIAIDPAKLGGSDEVARIADSVVKYTHSSAPDVRRRMRQLHDGIEVDDSVWREVQALAGLPETNAADPSLRKDDE